jgi:hypothetical protein
MLQTKGTVGALMKRHQVVASRDHIQSLGKAPPLQAIEEMIWNGLDAGGLSVEVRLKQNNAGGVETIEVADKGCGIPYGQLDRVFGSIGDSVKVQMHVNSEGRQLHGREGKGRFKALALSSHPVWETTYREGGKLLRYKISIQRDDPDFFEASEPVPVKAGQTGTVLRAEFIDVGEQYLLTDGAVEKLTQRFALYLSEYPKTRIIYGDHLLEIDSVIGRQKDYPLATSLLGRPPATLRVIEWRFKLDSRKLYLCNDSGFARHDIPLRLHAPGIDFTAYLRSAEVDGWHESGKLGAEELDRDVGEVVELAREQLRGHIRERLAEEAQDVVAEWKELEIYPYRNAAASTAIEAAERQVFDIVAVSVNEVHPSFRDADRGQKELTLALIRQALESNPSSLTAILRDVVKLPQAEQDSFAELLERTPLSALIRAGKIVADRLDTIQAFEHILFHPDWKAKLLERTQLHRLLVHELWLLGEEYALATDDEGLNAVLKKHMEILGRGELAPDVEIRAIDGKEAIPDLMLARSRRVDRSLFEHLVVELKRPKDALGQKEVGQIEKYAFTIIEDERFRTEKVRWVFVLLGNDLDAFAKRRASSDSLPEGCIYREGNVTIWVHRWADVLVNAKDRYEFFRDKLQLQASTEHGMDRLTKQYQHLLVGRGKRKAEDLRITKEKLAETDPGAPAQIDQDGGSANSDI